MSPWKSLWVDVRAVLGLRLMIWAARVTHPDDPQRTDIAQAIIEIAQRDSARLAARQKWGLR